MVKLHKPYTKFKIKAEDTKLFLYVYVYNTLEDFQAAVRAYDLKFNKKTDLKNCLGIHHGYSKHKVKRLGPIGIQSDELSHNDIGIIRLIKGYTDIYVVAHEVAHAAMHQYRVVHKWKADFSEAVISKNIKIEEEFCYLYGSLLEDMSIKLSKFGYITS